VSGIRLAVRRTFLAELNGENSRVKVQNVREDSSAERRRDAGRRADLALTFMHYDLGYFDDETCRLEPIENPFGPKVLPMSPE
jgi:hypothetical protein